ncbi:MAG: N-acetylmuramoyl-L-alanine amidase, partial [Lachnospiraceae bacterium]
MKRIVAWLLVIMMACSSVQVQASNVKPEEIGQESKTPTGESEPTQVGSQDAIQQDAPQDTANQEPAQQKEAVSEKKTGEQEVKINYLCVGSPYIATEGEQKVVLSWGDGTENISDMKLVYEKNDGTKAEWACEKQEKETYLFTKQFSGEDKGTYRVSGIQFIQDGQIHEYLLDNLGINARFGIGEEYEGYVREESVKAKGISEEDVSATVLNLETNETKEVETGVKEALSDAVKEANVTTGPKKSSKARSAARARELVIALDPGHDDTHAGASGNGLREQELTLKIAMYCKAELERYSGVRIHMTRTTGACPNPGQSSTEDNKARIRQAVAAGASVYISFHLNASTSSGVAGAEVYYPNYNWKPDIGMHGEALAQKILDEIVALGISNRGIKLNTSSGDYTYEDGSLADAYTVQNTCKKLGIPGLIIEHAFVSNSGDASFLDSESDLQRLGQADAAGIAKYYGLSIGTWIQDNNGWKYQESNGNFVVNTWKAIGGSTYYFDQNGYRVSGWQDIGGKRYFFMPDGVMLTGWISFGAARYFLMPDGHMLTGWCSFGDTRYYLGTDGVMQTGWRDIGGKRYFFMPEGYMLRGWISFGNTRYYLDANGAMVTGNQTINGTQYIFDQAGVLQSYTGWRTMFGKQYYYKNDIVQTGWQEIEGNRHFFMPDGVMLTGWISFGSIRYYLGDNGIMLKGWQQIGSFKYYLGSDGIVQTGWRTVEGNRHFFMPDGHMLTGWISFGDVRYYLGLDGVMVTGKQMIGGIEYEFNSDGTMKGYTGWKTISGKQYYYKDNVMQTGWKDIEGNRHFFMPDGVMLTGWISFGSIRYYLGDNGIMLKGWQQIGSFKYYLGSDGIVQTGWRTVEGNRHFFMPDGHM